MRSIDFFPFIIDLKDSFGLQDACDSHHSNSHSPQICNSYFSFRLSIAFIYIKHLSNRSNRRNWQMLHDGEILSIQTSTDGNMFATGSSDKTIRIYDARGLYRMHVEFVDRNNVC